MAEPRRPALETIRDGASIRAFAIEAAARGKPVIAFKLGRSAAAAELAQSHTGALAGEDDLADAFLRDCGIARVETLEALLEAPALTRRMPIRPAGARRPVVGVVTTTGGGAAMVVDQLGIRGIEVQRPGPTTAARLEAAGIDAGHGRILDLTLAGAQYPVMKAALDAMLADPAYDLIVAVAGPSARLQPELAVRPIMDCAGAAAPLAAFMVIVVGFAGDYGYASYNNQRLSRTADTAAIAAVYQDAATMAGGYNSTVWLQSLGSHIFAENIKLFRRRRNTEHHRDGELCGRGRSKRPDRPVYDAGRSEHGQIYGNGHEPIGELPEADDRSGHDHARQQQFDQPGEQ